MHLHDVPAGPRWYRARIRRFGPLLGLVPMAVIGGVAWLSLRLGDSPMSGLVGLLGGVTAAPGLLIAGAPLGDDSRYPLAVVASIPFWILIGAIAAYRATRPAIASWHDYWRELTWLSIAVLLGATFALVLASAFLGESLIG